MMLQQRKGNQNNQHLREHHFLCVRSLSVCSSSGVSLLPQWSCRNVWLFFQRLVIYRWYSDFSCSSPGSLTSVPAPVINHKCKTTSVAMDGQNGQNILLREMQRQTRRFRFRHFYSGDMKSPNVHIRTAGDNILPKCHTVQRQHTNRLIKSEVWPVIWPFT